MIATETTIVLNQPYTILIGEGGVGVDSNNVGKNGTNSQFDSFVAIAGGGGGHPTSQSLSTNGQDGGSGGGGGGHGSVNQELPGAGTSGQGYSGGKGAIGSTTIHRSGGGGGGAGGTGEDGDPNGYGGNGGPASQWVVDQQWYAAGGGGGTRKENDPSDEKGGDGGSGGGVMLGGSGGPTPNVYDGTSAVQNTGSGGGAGWNTSVQSGANGIVKIWVPFSYTYDSSHFSNVTGTMSGSSASFTYNATSGTMVTFINPGSGTWTPV